MIGRKTRICGANGQWSGDAPVCQCKYFYRLCNNYLITPVAIDCGLLSDPEYGKVDVTGTTARSVATYSCNKGFKIVGPATRVCLITGEWSRTAPTCQRKHVQRHHMLNNLAAEDCGGLDDPANGNVDVSGTAFWDTATYSCNAGFELIGKAIRTCEENGQWSGVAPFCRCK